MKTQPLIGIFAVGMLTAGCGSVAAVSATAGAAVQAWRLGAIRFVSTHKGLALTSPQIECVVRLRHGRGTDVYFRPQPVRLATTRDAGSRQGLPEGGARVTVQPPAEKLAEVLEAVGTAVDAIGGSFTMSYTTVAVTATRTDG
jgi:hypothetical protein